MPAAADTASGPEWIAALDHPDSYPHECGEVQRIETHISWVFLTGQFAYKVKKPVRFGFIDFSTRQRRRHFCEEELRCNRAFAPELYLGLSCINRDHNGRYRVDGPGPAVESAVRMRQFPPEQQLDVLLERGELSRDQMRRFGGDLADLHAGLPRLEPGLGASEYQPDRATGPVEDNFNTLRPLCARGPRAGLIEDLHRRSRALSQALVPVLGQRGQSGFTRECHGDLHLSNLVWLNGRVRAFDCIEFNPDLRWIDTLSDVAFLMMDCSVRRREDLGYAFLDGYLDRSADYAGAVLLAYYQVYRSVVRAKVAALQLQEPVADGLRRTLVGKLDRHLQWADGRLRQGTGRLFLMSGLSGSGKSWVAERLAPEWPAVRLRSDVLRKALSGLAPDAPSGSPLDGGVYTAGKTAQVYEQLLRLAGSLLESGESVIVDASFPDRSSRQPFQQLSAKLGTTCTVLYCQAPVETLFERVAARHQAGTDASEADAAVLRRQMSRFEAPGRDEQVICIDTDQALDLSVLTGQIAARAAK